MVVDARLSRTVSSRPEDERLFAALVRICLLTVVAVVGLVVTTAPAWPQSEEPAWRAQWISAPEAPPQGPGVYHFRKDFDLTARPARLVVRASADNRYRLYVNGVEVSNGPARGDVLNWRYETVDIAPMLRAGRNVIAALVWNFGEDRPAAQVTARTGFLLQGEGEGAVLDTGPSWKVLTDTAYRFSKVVGPDAGDYYVAGPNETVDASLYPWGWESAGFDTSAWPLAVPLGVAERRGSNPVGLALGWQMVPRAIPLPEQRLERFAAVRRVSGLKSTAAFLRGSGDLVVPANSTVSLLVDNGKLTLGYPILVTSGGRGATATVTYSEALFDAEGRKGNRNEIAGKTIRGVRDRYHFDGGDNRRFQTLWLRSFRYAQLDVQTGSEPLRLRDFHAIFAAYPFQQRASFTSDAAWIDAIWKLDWHALRLSAFETYWDTPYYEQLQYVGDTRIESLLSVYQAGDERLMRNALQQFDESRTSEGITRSSYPSSTPQLIPPFSLWWIGMIHDYWMLREDPAFIRSLLPGTRGVIDWYERHLDEETGLLGPMPWWNFVDWSYEGGVPPGGRTGGSTVLTLQLVLALREAAELEQALGRSILAPHYRALADRLVAAIQTQAWDDGRGLFADTPDKRSFSQQTNALALLADAVAPELRRDVMERILADPKLLQASFYFRFYVDEALRRSGLADRYLERLEPWREMLRLGLTATAETPEPTRSDSHAWSAHPNYHLLATVVGIRSAEPGFQKVEIAPALGRLRKAAATMPHPRGTVAVKLQRVGAAGVDARIELPQGVPGVFRWEGQSVALDPGVTRLRCGPHCRTEVVEGVPVFRTGG